MFTLPKGVNSTADRFWALVVVGGQDECWPWHGYTNPRTGYGQFHGQHITIAAHRLAMELEHGPIPAGAFVCHRCDNRSCCNPKHLYVGNARQNMADCIARGRVSSGARHSASQALGAGRPNAKLTDDKVREIRASTEPARVLAQRYGVCQQLVSDVRRRKMWKHVTDEAAHGQ